MANKIKELVALLALDPTSAELNFKMGQEYESIGQLASAVSFYLKCAEFNIERNKEYVYFSLIKIGECLDKQGQRQSSVSNSFLQAMQLMPHRPEAYLAMSIHYEKDLTKWQECYAMAQIGLQFSNVKPHPLQNTVNYPGSFAFTFEKALSAWWIGKQDESISLFKDLVSVKNLPKEYWEKLVNNMKKINNPVDRIAIILPVRDAGTGRSERLMKCLSSWAGNTEGLSDIHIIIDEDDVQNFGKLYEYKDKFNIHVKPTGLTLMEKVNTIGLDIAYLYKYICFIGDDIIFQTKWESEFINYLSSVPAGLAFANTLDRGDSNLLPTHPCITSNLVKAVGFYGCPAVHHNYFDNYWRDIAESVGYIKYFKHIVMDHSSRMLDEKDYIFWDIVNKQSDDGIRYKEYKDKFFESDLQKVREMLK